VDRPGVKAALTGLDERLAATRARIPWDGAPLGKKALADYCTAEGIPCPNSVAKDDEDFAEWVEQYGDAHPVCRAMGEWRSVNALRETVATLAGRVEGGLYRGGLKYFGAQYTGRWSGDGGFNVQNMPRGEMHGVDLRSLFRAPAGHTFVAVDLSQIEPRILAHLAGNTAMLDAVRAGWHIYEAFARSLGWDFKQGTLKDSNKAGYAMAKGMCLGLGYGMSADKFVKAAPALTVGQYHPSPADASRAVRQFRDRNPGIVSLWNGMDALLRESVKDGAASVTLPSGREIRYFDLRADGRGVSGLTVRGDKRRKNLYGALLVENVVQATARDVFAEALLRLESAGVDVRLHVHDEAVALCRVDEAAEVARVMERCMTTPPEWMADLPLGCDVNVTEVYCK
jgi:DNA polymerase